MGIVIQFPSGARVEQFAAEAQATREKLATVEPARPTDPRLHDHGGRYNYEVGSKYDSKLSTKEIAALLRTELKAAVKAGKFPTGTKFSVRYRSYSGGSSIDISVTALPAGFALHNPERVRFEVEHPHEYVVDFHYPIFTPEAKALLASVKAMMDAYNYDRSDIQSDYFDVAFYGHAQYDSDLTRGDYNRIKSELDGVVRRAL